VYNKSAMSTLETTIRAPLTQWDDGTFRITGSRVPIDTVIYHFKLGATAEEIGYKFPSLQLADIYGAIYYYLVNRGEVEEYLRQQEAEGDAVQQRIESDLSTSNLELIATCSLEGEWENKVQFLPLLRG
jgi:uncharacterized protein (DUF433 family)